AAAAPARLRAISRTADAVTRRGRPIEAVSVRDFGDVAATGASGRALERGRYLRAASQRLRSLPPEAFLLALGGDNSVSIPCLQAFAARHGPGAGVIWFDAHPDLFATYDGSPEAHACALRRAMTTAGLSPRRVVLLGTRSFSREEAAFIAAERIEVITAAEWRASGSARVASRIRSRLKGCPAVYLAIDIDGFDASCAPGTGYPMPGGVGADAFFDLLERLFGALPLRAMDITEVCPARDPSDVTAFLAAQVVLETLGALGRGDPAPARPARRRRPAPPAAGPRRRA
ncbi:MAG: arginase family protein, partial [Planctomycetota bacterium]